MNLVARPIRAQAQPSHRADSDTYVAAPLGAKADGGWRGDLDNDTYVSHALRADGFDAGEDGTGRGTPLVPDTAYALKAHAARMDAGSNETFVPQAFGWNNSPSQTLKVTTTTPPLKGSQSAEPAVAFQEAQTGVREYKDAGSLRANGPGHDPVGTRIREGMAVRRLTPRECERLQGFPDDYTLIPLTKAQQRRVAADFAAYLRASYPEITDAEIARLAKDGPRYRALGNSMAVPVMAWIGRRIALVAAALAERPEQSA